MKRLIPLMMVLSFLALAALACSVSIDLGGGEPPSAVRVSTPTPEREQRAEGVLPGAIAAAILYGIGAVVFLAKMDGPGLYEIGYLLVLLAGVGAMVVGFTLQNPFLVVGGLGTFSIGTPAWALFGDRLIGR